MPRAVMPHRVPIHLLPEVKALARDLAWFAVIAARPNTFKRVKQCRKLIKGALKILSKPRETVFRDTVIPKDAMAYLQPIAKDALRDACKRCQQCALNDLAPP